MNTNVKGVLLAAGAYVATMYVAIFFILSAIVILLNQPLNCTDMGRALLSLWTTIALVFTASVAVVAVITRRYAPGMTGRVAVVVVYGAALMVSFVVIAFGLMILFNC